MPRYTDYTKEEKDLKEKLDKYHREMHKEFSDLYDRNVDDYFENKIGNFVYYFRDKRYGKCCSLIKTAQSLMVDLQNLPEINIPYELRIRLTRILPYLDANDKHYILRDTITKYYHKSVRSYKKDIKSEKKKILNERCRMGIEYKKIYTMYSRESKRRENDLDSFCSLRLSHIPNSLYFILGEQEDIRISSAAPELIRLESLISSGTIKDKNIISQYHKIKEAYNIIAELEYVNDIIDEILKLNVSTQDIDIKKLKDKLEEIKRKNENTIRMQEKYIASIKPDRMISIYETKEQKEQISLEMRDRIATASSKEIKKKFIREYAIKKLYIDKKISKEIYELYKQNNYKSIDISQISDKKQKRTISKTELLINKEIVIAIKQYQIDMETKDSKSKSGR